MKFIPTIALVVVVATNLVWDKIELRQEMNAIEANVEEVRYGPAL